jgi:hypothetical protein
MRQRLPSLDWPLLVGVRERRRESAQEALQHEQQVTAVRVQEVQQAEADWRAQIAARATHAQQMRQAVTSIAQLQQGGAWDGALAQRILAREHDLAVARQRLADQQNVLAEKRRALLKADAELEQARQMQQRHRQERRQLAELRLEDTLDETGAQTWQSVRRRRAVGGLA